MADVTTHTDTFGERYHFLVRRLHSLSGIIPVGVFLCIHLSINAAFMAGPGAFQFAVDKIHSLNNLGILKAVELVFIIIPIAFHAIVGIVIWLTSMPNPLQYRYGGNIRYTLQRWAGLAAVAFILVHLWHVHWVIPGGAEFDPHAAAETTLAAMSAWWTGPVYAIGVLCAVYHLANGVWTFLITWGIIIGPESQKRSGYVCVIIGIVLGLLGMGSLITLKTMDASTLPPTGVESHTTGVGIGADLYA